MALEDIEVKVSAKRVSASRAIPFGWCFAVSKRFLEAHPDLPERMQIIREDDTLYVQFGDEGNLFSLVRSMWQWAQISKVWLTNFHPPTAYQPATQMTAIYDDETHRIALNPNDYTNLMVEAMSSTPYQPPLSEHSDRFRVAPRGQRTRKTPPFFKRAPLPEEANEEEEHPLFNHPRVQANRERQQTSTALAIATLPNSVVSWTDSNVKALRQLIMDLQMRRPEIVFSIINGIVTMKKQTFEDI
jgi:hypothetical protein